MRKPPRKEKLTELLVQRLRPEAAPFLVWDTKQQGLVLRVQPSGHRAFKVIYSRHGRPRWLHLGNANAIGLATARQLAAETMVAVMRGADPAAEKRAQRTKGNFEELANRYVEDSAKRNNKSWKQADALVRRHLIPRWGKLGAHGITRADVKTMMTKIDAPIVANQTLAAASAIFTWALKEDLMSGANPCRDVDRNPTATRERVLSDGEIPKFWAAFDSAGVTGTALKLILLTGQRPGEVAHMRFEHIIDGWWQMPGAPVAEIGWPGTKNGQAHRVWLPTAARALIAELGDQTTGWVFSGSHGRPVRGFGQAMRAICKALDITDAARPAAYPRHHDYPPRLRSRYHEPYSEPQGGWHRQRVRPASIR
jgi:integrase